MITIGEEDILAGWRDSGTNHFLSLVSNRPLDRELGGPLFDAGVVWLMLTRRSNFSRAAAKTDDSPFLIIFLLEGRVEVSVGRRRWNIEPGFICILPRGANVRYATEAEAASWIQFIMEPDKEWKPLAKRPGRVRKCEYADLIYPLVNRLLTAKVRYTLDDRKLAPFLAAAILTLLKRELMPLPSIVSEHANAVRALGEKIQAAPTEAWPRERMVKETGIPSRSLTRHFKSVYGFTPLEMIHRCRLEIAIEHLHSERLSIEQVARKCGYDNRPSFSKMFFRHLGVGPAAFRRDSTGRQ